MDSVSLQDGGAGSPRLRSSLPFRSLGEWKGARGKARAALTPGPAPALRERGVLVSGLGIVDRHRYRQDRHGYANSRFHSLSGSGRGPGEGAGRSPPFLSRSVGEEGGLGGR